MKKIKAWIQSQSKKALLIKTLIIPVFIVPLIVLLVWYNQDVGAREQAALIEETNISVSDQTYIVSASGVTPVDWEPTEEDMKVGFVPVISLPSNFFMNKLESVNNSITSSSINQQTGVVSFSTKSNDTEVIYVSTLLEEGVIASSEIFTNASVPVVIVTPNTLSSSISNFRTSTPNRFGTAATTTATNTGTVTNINTSTVGNISELPSSIGSTSPYYQAIKSKYRAATATPANANQTLFFTIFSFILLTGLILGFMAWLRRKNMKEENATSRDGRKNIGGVRNRNEKKTDKDSINEEIPVTRFADVAGCDEAIEEMSEMVLFLKEPDKFVRVGAKPPRGALLVGPPGTGKTLLARAVAGEAGVPFYAVAGSDFVEMYVGVGAKRVRELFDKARTHEEGAIIFIDEVDAIGRKRQSGDATGANTEAESTLNALLVEMDGFSQNNIIVLAATNRDDILDAALTRPGRLDRKVQVPLPDRAGRERILEVHSRNKPLGEDVDLNIMARRTPGMSGAELEQLVNEACMTAARDGREIVSAIDFDHAVATVAMGKARHSAIVTPHDRAVTAWHEGGHTVAAMVIEEADEPVSVSIIPRGPAGGVTWMAQGDDLFLTRRRAFARLVVAMGGRAAEEIYLDGEFTSGPHGDLSAATQTAMEMVTKYGMTDAGLMIKTDGLLSTGSKVTDETIHAVEQLLAEALEVAREVLAENRILLENVVEALLENDTLSHAELIELRGGKKFIANMPLAPKDYRKEKNPVVEEVRNTAPVERVRFVEEPKKKRFLKLGKIEIHFPDKKDKRKKAF